MQGALVVEMIQIVIFLIGAGTLIYLTRPRGLLSGLSFPFHLCDASNTKLERKFLLKDLRQAKKSFEFVVGCGFFEFWNDSKIIKSFQRAVNRGVRITLAIEECNLQRLQSTALQTLLPSDSVQLYTTKKRLPETYRLVDGVYAHTFNFTQNKFFRMLSTEEEITKRQKMLINSCLENCVIN